MTGSDLYFIINDRSVSLNDGNINVYGMVTAKRLTYVDVRAGSMSTTKSSWKSLITFSLIHT